MKLALLRGVNVGRAKRIAMADLRALAAGLGHRRVHTLLNSGNLVFEPASRRAAAAALARGLEAAIAAHCGFDVAVVVVDADELAALVAAQPLRERATDPSRLLLAFAPDAAALAAAAPLAERDWAPEALALAGRAAWLWCPAGVIASRLLPAFERATGGAATSRNWATVLKLQQLLADAARAG